MGEVKDTFCHCIGLGVLHWLRGQRRHCLVATVVSELVLLIKYKTKQNGQIFEKVVSWYLIQRILFCE